MRGPRQIHATVEEKLNELFALCQQHRVKRLALFGSAATGEFDPARSDLGFVVEYESQEPMKLADNYFGLLFGLEALFGRHIDLVERKAIKNRFFRQSMEETQVMVYEAA